MSPLRFLITFAATMRTPLCITLLFSLYAHALSTRDIFPTNDALAPDFRKIVTTVGEVEPFCSYWSATWEPSIPKDSVRSTLINAVTGMEKIVEEIDVFKLSLLRGLIWHYLYQLEVDSGFGKADRIAHDLRQHYPDNIEGAWLQGINLVKASQLYSGFTVLDSLRTSQKTLPDDFYKDYASLSALTFLPGDLSFLDQQTSATGTSFITTPYSMAASENIPLSNHWEVISTSNTENRLPGFVFGADFGLKKPFTLTYPKLFDKQTYIMRVVEDNTMAAGVPHSLFFDPDAPPLKMHMKICVQPVNTKTSLDQYLFDIVHNQYDEIREMKVPNRHVIALRCYRKSVTRGLPDSYTAYVAFDKTISQHAPSFYSPATKTKKTASRITMRYVISMNTVKDVEEKADDLFQDVVTKFNRFSR